MFGAKLRLVIVLAAALQTAPVTVWAQDQKVGELEKRVEELDQQFRVAERLRELKAEEADSKAKTTPTVNADQGGFTIRSGDGDYSLRVGADIQVDSRSFFGAGAASSTDGFLVRRLRPTISGTLYKYIDYLIRPDFGGGSTVINDAYAELKYFRRAKLRVGKFKPPVGLERLQQDDDTSFVERGLPTLLVPSRDIGYQLSGDLVTKRVAYAVGVFNGVPDNGLGDTAASGQRDFAGRLWLTPFAPSAANPLAGLGFGAGISGGNADGIALAGYRSFGQASFLPFATGVTQAGHRTRIAPQATYYYGPFGLLAEYTFAGESFKKGAAERAITLRAWQVAASYVLTGEKKSQASPVPRKVFDPSKKTWGAVELALRVGDFSAGRALYDYGLADATKAARRAHEWVGGVNWYLNKLLRISVDYGKTNFAGGATGGNRVSERVVIGRLQVNFL
jgi:phosphate-selective porin OprO and OprP